MMVNNCNLVKLMRRQWEEGGVGEEILGELAIERARNSAVGHVPIILMMMTS